MKQPTSTNCLGQSHDLCCYYSLYQLGRLTDSNHQKYLTIGFSFNNMHLKLFTYYYYLFYFAVLI